MSVMLSLILMMIFTSNITHNHYTALRMSSLELIVFAAAQEIQILADNI